MKYQHKAHIKYTECKPTGRSVTRCGVVLYEYEARDKVSKLRIFLADKAFTNGEAIRAKV